MGPTSLHRRSLLRGAIGIGAVATVGGLSTGCTPGTAPPTQASPDTTGTILPTYRAATGVTPDLKGTPDGILDGFLTYPSTTAAPLPTPASGGAVSLHCEVGEAPPVVSANSYWQELNKRLGAELTVNGAPAADYPKKLATLLAGNDLADFVQIQPFPRLADALRAKFQDLTPFLNGDKVLDYPSLASLPTSAWANTVYDGGIFGIPYPQGAIGNLQLYRADLFESRGLSAELSSGAELLELCRALTDRKQNRWAHGSPYHMVVFISQMTGAPNIWGEDGGTFTHAYETDAYRQAIDAVAGMWKEGLFHPESFTGTSQRTAWFGAGTVAMSFNGYSVWSTYLKLNRGTNPDFAMEAVNPVGWDDGRAMPKHLNKGIYTFTAMKKAGDDRVREMLRVANWLASPFGTPEHLFRKYGVEGVHHTVKGTDPILTDKGTAEVAVPAYYLAKESPVLYEPGMPDEVKRQYEVQQDQVPGGIRPANVGLVSDTEQVQGARLDRAMVDTVTEVIQGRKSLSDWDAAVTAWRSDGGDSIRNELEKAFAG